MIAKSIRQKEILSGSSGKGNQTETFRFFVDETDASNYLWDQFEALEPTPMLLGFQSEFEDHCQP
jgi:hypothetical protein